MNRRAFLRFLVATPVVGPAVARSAIRVATTMAPNLARDWADELAAVTRRAFVPAMIQATRHATPLMSALLTKKKE